MPVLILTHRGYELRVPLERNTYYTQLQLETRKTIYHIVFEFLVDKKAAPIAELTRKYRTVAPNISENAFLWAIEKIEAALKKSPDKRLQKLRFIRIPKGGDIPIISRNHPKASFTQKQREIVTSTIYELLKKKPKPTNEQMRSSCMKALADSGLVWNVRMGNDTIGRYFKKAKMIKRNGLRQRAMVA